MLAEVLRSDSTARDPAAVVHSRLRRFCSGMPQATLDPLTEHLALGREDLRSLVTQVRQRILNRTEFVGKSALLDEPSWTPPLMEMLSPNADPLEASRIIREVAVYRDRWNVGDSPLPLGPAPSEYDWEQRSQWGAIQQAIRNAASFAPAELIPSIVKATGVDQTLTTAGWQL